MSLAGFFCFADKGKIEMTTQLNPINSYETSELKLAALILSEFPDCTFDIYEQGNSLRKTIRIKYSQQYKEDISRLQQDFINKKASTNVYTYNKALNMIRDRLRGCENGTSQ